MRTSLPKSKKLIQISEAAAVLGVSIDTVRRWDKKGILHSERVDGKNRYFSLSELEDIKFAQPLPISEASKYLNLSATTMRRLEARGLIKPERNAAGERVYDKQSLQKFLDSEYFLRQKKVEEKILQPLKDPGSINIDEQGEPRELPTSKVLNMLQAETSREVGKLVVLKKILFTSSLFGVTLLTSALIIITMLFLVFPEQTAHFFGYGYKNNLSYAPGSSNRAILGASTDPKAQTSVSDKVLGVALRPISGISLGIVKQISPETYKKIVPPSGATSESDFFSIDDQGNIVPNAQIKLPDISYLKVEGSNGEPPQNLIQNITNVSSTSATTEVIGLKEVKSDNASLTVSTFDNISTLSLDLTDSIGTAQIKDNSITSAKLKDVSVLTDDSIKTSFIKDGAVTNSKLSQITDSDKVAGSAVQLASGGGLVNNSGLSLLTSCSSNQVLAWNGSAWVCTDQTGGSLTEADTLASVTGRGAITATDVTLSAVTLNGLLTLSSSGITGGGLSTDCSSSTKKLIWNSATGQFGCGTDLNTGGGGSGSSDGTGGWYDNGSTLTQLDPTENVGIGTSSTIANYKLHVQGSSFISGFLGVGSSANVAGNVGIGSSLTVASGSVFSGGLVVSGGSVVLPSSVITNSNLVNSSVTVSPGTGLTGGGSVSLGGTITLNTVQDIATTASPVFGNLGIGGSLVTTGNVGIGKSLVVTSGTSLQSSLNVLGLASLGALNTSGNVGLGASTIHSSIGIFNSGINVLGTAVLNALTATNINSSTLTTTGNVGVGGSLSVTSGANFSAGLAVTGGAVQLPNASISNANLQNSALTVTAGTGLTGGGLVSLGGTVTLNTAQDIATNASPSFGNIGVGGSLVTTGNIGVGKSLQVTSGTNLLSSLNVLGLTSLAGLNTSGNVGLGSSLNLTSAGVFQSGVKVSGHSDLTTLSTSGNTGIGGSLTVFSGLSIPNSSIYNASLVNSSLTVTAGTGLIGGGVVSLGGSVTVSAAQDIASSASPTFNALNLNGLLTLSNSGIIGGGLSGDCSASNKKLLWDSGSNQFVCGVDLNTGTGGGSGSSDGTGGWYDNTTNITLLNPSENVGIGTSSTIANAKLQVRGAGNTTGLAFYTTNNANSTFGLAALDNGNVGIGTTSANYNLLVNGTGYFTNFLGVGSSLNTTGNVGIGGSLSVVSGVSLPNSSISNANLQNSALTVTAGTGLTGGGLVSLGGSITINAAQDISTTASPFFGNLGIGGSLVTTGNIGVGKSLTVNSAASLQSSLSVLGLTSLAGLNTSGNVGVGASLNVLGANTIINTAGLNVTGGLSLPSASISNVNLVNSSLTVTAGTGLTGGGVVSLGGITSVALDLTAANNFSGIQTFSNGIKLPNGIVTNTGNVGIGISANLDYNLKVNGTGYFSGFLGVGSSFNVSGVGTFGNIGVGGSLVTTGNVGIGKSLVVNDISTFNGTVGIGSSLNVTSTGIFSSGIKVSGASDLAALTASGLINANGGLTLATGQIFTVNGDAFTDLTGTNLTISGGALSVVASPAFTNLTTTGNIGIGGSLVTTGNVGIGKSLVVNDISTFNGTVGIGSSLNVTSAASFLSGIKVVGGLSLPAGSISNNNLTNSSVTVTAGTGLTGGGTVSLGGTITLSTTQDLTTAGTPTFASQTLSSNGKALSFTGSTPSITSSGTNSFSIFSQGNVGIGTSGPLPAQLTVKGLGTTTGLTFTTLNTNSSQFGLSVLDNGNVGIGNTNPNYNFLDNGTAFFNGFVGIGSSLSVSNTGLFGNIGVGGSLVTTGNVGIGKSLVVNDISVLTGTVGIGSSLNVSSAATFLSGIKVSGISDLGAISGSSLSVSGNVGLGGSATHTSIGIFNSGLTVLGFTSLQDTRLSTLITTGNVAVGSSLNVLGANTTINTSNLSVSNGLSLPAGSISNANLTNSSVTVSAGTGLTGGGTVSLGGTVTLSTAQDIATTASPFFGNIGIGGSLVTTGNVGIGKSLVVNNISTFLGTVGIGSSLNVTSAASFLSGIKVSGTSDLGVLSASSFNVSGTVGLGSSASITSNLRLIGQNCSTYSNGGKLTTDANGNVYCAADNTSAGGGGVTSLNSLSGALTIANSTGNSSTITIDNAAADGSTKGIAAFNGTNFSASLGVINTIQDISTTSSPVFGNIGIGGSLVTTGNVGIGKSLVVNDISSFAGTVGIGSSLNVTSAVNFLSGLKVGGHSLLSTLTTTGNTGIGGTALFSSLSNHTSGLVVSGFTSLQDTRLSTLNASGTINANGGLTINGDAFTDLTGTNLQVSAGALGTVANPTFSTSITTPVINSTTGLSLFSQTGSVGIGTSTIDYNFKANGTGYFSGFLGVGSSFNVSGVGTFGNIGVGGSLITTGNVGIGKSLVVNDISTFLGTVGVGSSLNVSSAANFLSGIKVAGHSDLSTLLASGNVGIGGTATHSSLGLFSSGLTVAGFTSLNDTRLTTLITTGNVGVGASLNVLGANTVINTANLNVTNGLSLPAGSISNSNLTNSSLTVTAGTGLTGGGLVSLGSSVTLSTIQDIATTAAPTFASLTLSASNKALTFSGSTPSISSNTSFSLFPQSGNVGIGTSSSPAALTVKGLGITTGLTFTTLNTNSSQFGLSVLDNGNVGVGNTNPNYNFLTQGTGYFSGFLGVGSSFNVSGVGTFGNIGVGGSLVTTGNVGIGKSLVVNDISTLSGTVGIGSSLNVSSAATFLSGIKVSGISDLGAISGSSLSVSGNVGLGGSATHTSIGIFNSGLTVSGFTSLNDTRLSTLITTGNVGVGSSLNVLGANTVINTANLNVTSGLSLPAGSITNSNLTNSSLTLTAGTGLTGGGTVSLGSSVTISAAQDIATTASPFFGNIGIGGSLVTTGNVGIGKSLVVNNISSFLGTVGIGSSLNVTSAATFLSGVKVSGTSDLGALFASGNVGLGSSASITSNLRLIGQNCSTYSNGGKLTTDAKGNVYCGDDNSSAGGGGVTSLNSLSGALSIANATTGGSTITINDAVADGSTKGIATFNATNFSASTGIINTIQDISTTSTPTFASLKFTGTTPSISSSTSLSLFSQTGSVGIGTSTIDYNFKVNGTGYFSGFLGIGGSLNVSGGSNFGNVGIGGSLVAAGNVGIGKSLVVNDISSFLGTVGIGSSLNVSSVGTFSSGLSVSGFTSLANLLISGNTGIGGTAIFNSLANHTSGLLVTGFSSLQDTRISNLITTGNTGIGGSLNVLGANTIINTAGLNVTGGLSLPSASISNVNLVNSAVTITAGTGLSGGGSVSLGGSVTLSTSQDIATTASPTFVNLSTTGNIGIAGSLVVNGNIGIGKSLVVNNISTFNGTVGIGSSVNVSSAASFLSGIKVSGHSDLSTLFASGNVGLGGTVTHSSLGLFSSGLTVSGFTNLNDTRLTTLITTGNVGVGGSLNVLGANTIINTAGLNVTGGLSLPAASISNNNLVNSAVTITAGTGLSGGGSVSLGGTVTLSTSQDIATTASPTFTNLTTTGNIGIAGSLVANGNVGIGKSLVVNNISTFNGTVGIGSSLNVSSAATFLSGLSVVGNTQLSTLFASGNVGIGNSLVTTSAGVFQSGIKVTAASDLAALTATSYYGAGLTSCSDLTNSKLLWTAATGQFSCGSDQTGAGGTTWNSITTPNGNLSLAMSTNTTSFNWATGTGTSKLFSLTTDSSANGTGALLSVLTGSGSTVLPLNVMAGNSFGLSVNASGNVGIGITNSVTGGKLIVMGGNVGIGTSKPSATFQIGSDLYLSAKTLAFSTDTGKLGIGTTTPGGLVGIAGSVGIGVSFANSTVPSNGLIVQGNVGIGQSDASAMLAVAGNVSIGWTGANPTITGLGLSVFGSVGIGTTTAIGQLNIQAKAILNGDQVTISNLGQASNVSGYSNLQLSYLGGTAANIESSAQRIDMTAGTGNNSIWNGLRIAGDIGAGAGVTKNGIKLEGALVGGAGIGNAIYVDRVWDYALVSQMSAGNVGIGTTRPVATFQVGGNIGIGGSGLTFSALTGKLGLGTTNPGGTLGVAGNVGIGVSFAQAASPANGLIVQGNIGIGRSDASSTLAVAGNVNIGWTGVNPTISGLGLSVRGNVGIGTTSPRGQLEVSTGMSNKFYAAFINGYVGIGQTTPTNGSIVPNSSYLLSVQGKIQAQGYLGSCIAGTQFRLSSSGACNQDVAEIYQSSEDVEPGDVLVVDPTGERLVKKSSGAYEETIIGVVSTSPGLLLGVNGDNVALGGEASNYADTADPKLPAVALSGKVPLKVNNENGSIKAGDYLTSSSIPGVAMKATKAGSVIGKALSAFSGEGVGSVMVSMGVGHFNGVSVSDLFIPDQFPVSFEDQSPVILDKLVSEKGKITAENLSEVFTDRLVAGLEVITPKVTTEDLSVKKINGVTLDEFAERIATQSGQSVNIESLLSQASASAKLASKFEITEDSLKVLTGLKIDKGLEVGLDAKVVGKLTADGGLVVTGPAEFKDKSVFQALVEFMGNVIFHGDINFEGRPTFNKDTAGSAIVQKQADSVDIAFDKEYASTPLVNISITLDNQTDQTAPASQQLLQEASQSALEKQILDGDIRYIVTKRSSKGFTIKLNKPAVADLTFSWSALAVKDVKTSISQAPASSLNILGIQTSGSSSALPSPTPAPNLTPPPETSQSAAPSPLTIKIKDNELGFLRVREEAATSSNEVAQVLPGQIFQALVEKNNWYEIEYKPDFYGWVMGSYVAVQK